MLSIIKSHFHKGKTGFIITGLFVILSVLMMIVGLSICLGMGDLYYNARNLSNSPDLAVFVYEELNGPLSKRIISAINEREDIEKVDSQLLLWQEMPVNDNSYQCTFIFSEGNTMSPNKVGFLNIDDQNNKFKPYIRDQVSGEGFKIYVTGNYLITGHVGDKVMYRYNGENYWGYVAGVYDDMTKIYSEVYYYVDNDFYQMVRELSKTDHSILEEQIINVKFTYKDDKENAKAQLECGKAMLNIANEYNYEQKLIYGDDAKIIGAGYNYSQTFKEATSSFILILGAAMITFSVIVAVIVALVIGFLVRSSVMDEVRNLGVFKALGYTTVMLRLSYLAIYSVISGICMIVGIILGITLMPTFVNIITDMARLECSRAIGLNVGSIFVAIALIIAVISAVVMLATSRVKRVTPLSAMRNNFETHSFKRNLVPFAKSKLPINSTLGVKSVTSEVNRSVMVVVVVLIMSLLCSFVSVVFYNLKVDQTAIINMAATENPDYIIGLRYEDSAPYFDAIRNMDGYQADMLAEVYCGGYLGDSDDWIRGEFFERFDILRTNFVYKGRYPKHKNEIIVNEKFAKQYGFEIGDSFTVSFDEFTMNAAKNEYVIVGYYQSLFENCCYMGFLDNIIDFFPAEKLKTAARMFYFDKDKVPT
ncbi:MAG: ABC transporter permease, partial [Clostridia bacterium]|nr:ABC transporter permease [Clostridia bacterium]